MAKRRKLVTMLVTVSVNPDMPASDARREVRTLVNEQRNYSWDQEDIRVRKIQPDLDIPRSVKRFLSAILPNLVSLHMMLTRCDPVTYGGGRADMSRTIFLTLEDTIIGAGGQLYDGMAGYDERNPPPPVDLKKLN